MGNKSKQQKHEIHSFRDILSTAPIMPDESIQHYEAFKAGMLADLEPSSAYAHVIADNIIANEWELYRLRRWFEQLRLARGEDRLTSEVLNSLSQEAAESLDLKTLVKSAMSHTNAQKPALKALEELDIDVSRMLASAYVAYDECIDHFETQLMSLERRRRRLREDFGAINNRSKTTIEDAELVE